MGIRDRADRAALATTASGTPNPGADVPRSPSQRSDVGAHDHEAAVPSETRTRPHTEHEVYANDQIQDDAQDVERIRRARRTACHPPCRAGETPEIAGSRAPGPSTSGPHEIIAM